MFGFSTREVAFLHIFKHFLFGWVSLPLQPSLKQADSTQQSPSHEGQPRPIPACPRWQLAMGEGPQCPAGDQPLAMTFQEPWLVLAAGLPPISPRSGCTRSSGGPRQEVTDQK